MIYLERKKIVFFGGILLSLAFVFPKIVFAQEVNNLMLNFINNTPLITNPDIVQITLNAVRYLLNFIGVVALVMIILGGFAWMTAMGNEEKVQKAKKIIISGLTGLIIILLSYAIVAFFVARLEEFK